MYVYLYTAQKTQFTLCMYTLPVYTVQKYTVTLMYVYLYICICIYSTEDAICMYICIQHRRHSLPYVCILYLYIQYRSIQLHLCMYTCTFVFVYTVQKMQYVCIFVYSTEDTVYLMYVYFTCIYSTEVYSYTYVCILVHLYLYRRRNMYVYLYICICTCSSLIICKLLKNTITSNMQLYLTTTLIAETIITYYSMYVHLESTNSWNRKCYKKLKI